MTYIRYVIMLLLLMSISGCSIAQTKGDLLPTAYALPGTKTAVVGIALDRKGFPKETVKEIVLQPGQKVVLAGPDEFSVIFKNKKTPNKIVTHKSSNGAILIEIPKDILENPEFIEEFRKNKFLRFDYSINVNGRELDPPIIIRRDG